MQRPAFPAAEAPPPRPVLHLSGPKLRAALERLIAGADAAGGIERWVRGLEFKAAVFARALGSADEAREPAAGALQRLGARSRPTPPGPHAAIGAVPQARGPGAGGSSLDEQTFLGLCALMPTVRRRIAPWLASAGFESARALVGRLLADAPGGRGTDARIAEFCAGFPQGRDYRYARDLAAELLHWSAPERFALMTRWVWDRQASSGVLREIWHDDEDPALAQLPDGAETFLALREELAQYLTDNGFFRDIPWYVDLLCAQVYASYVVEQGGAYLRTDFTAADDPMQYLRRMLGLDGIDLESGATRLKLANGGAFALRAAAHEN